MVSRTRLVRGSFAWRRPASGRLVASHSSIPAVAGGTAYAATSTGPSPGAATCREAGSRGVGVMTAFYSASC